MTVETIHTNVRPHINLATIARAERLVSLGAAWTPDEVLRKALAMLERAHLEGRSS